jgi:adenosylmethionine-8-amino-7-oxononanoate aminotransferase
MNPADHVFHRAEHRPIAVRAHGSTIVTADGRSILDGAAGAIACSIGHGHPAVIAAMAEQAATVSYVHAHSFETELPCRGSPPAWPRSPRSTMRACSP